MSSEQIRFSICIPVYNFGAFIGETLDSILDQRGLDRSIEILVVDGASTDNTEAVVKARSDKFDGLRYVKLPKRGGIDADMEASVALARGEYCWLFSGDDLMRRGALISVLRWIGQGHDVFICKHSNCDKKMRFLGEHPVFCTDDVRVANLAEAKQRIMYLADSATTEALFSFMSGLVIRREAWMSVGTQSEFMGSCWGHVARLLKVAETRLTVCFVGELWLDRRGDNDSFLDNGVVRRLAIAVDGYLNMANRYFGEKSAEAMHIRRMLRNDLKLPVWMYARRKVTESPESESLEELNRLMTLCYSDPGLHNSAVRITYQYCPLIGYRSMLLVYRVFKKLRLQLSRKK